MEVEYSVTRKSRSSVTVYLTNAETRKEAILKCMEHTRLGIDNEAELVATLAWFRSLTVDAAEPEYHENDNTWTAEPFIFPMLDDFYPVVQIAELKCDMEVA